MFHKGGEHGNQYKVAKSIHSTLPKTGITKYESTAARSVARNPEIVEQVIKGIELKNEVITSSKVACEVKKIEKKENRRVEIRKRSRYP